MMISLTLYRFIFFMGGDITSNAILQNTSRVVTHENLPASHNFTTSSHL